MFRDRPPRAALERLFQPPLRLRDRTLDAHEADGSPSPLPSPSSRQDAIDVACWTPLGDDRRSPHRDTSDPDVDPMATLLADPSTPGDAGSAVDHTLVFEVEGPVHSIGVDYGSSTPP
ncbi:hypothetical protein ACFQL0_05505 [Haloplanus litoreus]|uniref:hypothetical protein n=1 Tax=Haloplanus litoreus TaxID=767515 RepID=UPI0036095EEF